MSASRWPIPHQAGCGGTAPSRGKVGESVKQINDRFPHWFNAEFKKFNEQPERLPFDQHCLVALVAPRPVLFPNAVEDTWANPDGQFEVLKAAEPAYALLQAGGLDAKEMPEPGKLVDEQARLLHPPRQALDDQRGLEDLPGLRRRYDEVGQRAVRARVQLQDRQPWQKAVVQACRNTISHLLFGLADEKNGIVHLQNEKADEQNRFAGLLFRFADEENEIADLFFHVLQTCFLVLQVCFSD